MTKKDATVLRRMDVLFKHNTISANAQEDKRCTEQNFLFSMDVHCEEGCVCKRGFQPNCPGWKGVDFIDVKLTFHAGQEKNKEHDEEFITFALLNGEGTALRLKMKVKKIKGESKQLLSTFCIIDREKKIICNPGQRTSIHPLDMKAISIDTTRDDEVAEDRDDEPCTFQDLLKTGLIYADVWSTKTIPYSPVNHSSCSEDSMESGSEPEWTPSEEEETKPAKNKITPDKERDVGHDKRFSNRDGNDADESVTENDYCDSSEKNDVIGQEDMGAKLEMEERLVNENCRKIGFLRFKRPKENHALCAAAALELAALHQTVPTKRKKKDKENDYFNEFGFDDYKQHEQLFRVDVVARRIEDLIRNANKAGNFQFLGQLRNIGVSLPDSEKLENLGVSLFTMKEAGIRMTKEQQLKRDQEMTIILLDNESDDDVDDNTPEDIHHQEHQQIAPNLECNSIQTLPKRTIPERISDIARQVLSENDLTLYATEHWKIQMQQVEKTFEQTSESIRENIPYKPLIRKVLDLESDIIRAKQRIGRLEIETLEEGKADSIINLGIRILAVENSISLSGNGMKLAPRIAQCEKNVFGDP